MIKRRSVSQALHLERKEARDEEELALESGQSFPCGPAHEHPIEVWEALELRSQMTTGRTKQAQKRKWQLKVYCFVVVGSSFCLGCNYFLGFRKDLFKFWLLRPENIFGSLGAETVTSKATPNIKEKEGDGKILKPKFRSWKGMIKIIPEIDKNRIGTLPVFGIEEE